jgi:hypothetical protein
VVECGCRCASSGPIQWLPCSFEILSHPRCEASNAPTARRRINEPTARSDDSSLPGVILCSNSGKTLPLLSKRRRFAAVHTVQFRVFVPGPKRGVNGLPWDRDGLQALRGVAVPSRVSTFRLPNYSPVPIATRGRCSSLILSFTDL